MTTNQYLKCRCLQKTATTAGGGVLAGLGRLTSSGAHAAAKFIGDVAKLGIENTTKTAMMTIPALGLLTSWMIYNSVSPKAVADNATLYAKNAIERETLAQSLRDLEEDKVNDIITAGKKKYHDQFL